MSEEQKRLLERQLWNIADTLRGKMDADEFRDYFLGFIFYKYLSEKMHLYADKILQEDGIMFKKGDRKQSLRLYGSKSIHCGCGRWREIAEQFVIYRI